jgi:hypothetical protein
MSEKQAIKAVVEKRIDSLDDFFVAVLRVCGGAARDDGNIDLAGKSLGALRHLLRRMAIAR